MASFDDTRHIDPFKSGRYPLHLGSSFQERAELEKRFYSVKCKPFTVPSKHALISKTQDNHKPPRITSSRNTTLTNAESNSKKKVSLIINDKGKEEESKEYHYQGLGRSTPTSFALTYNQEQQRFTLDHVDAGYVFNLISTDDPSDTNPTYPLLPLDEDQNPTASNPRHTASDNGSPPGSDVEFLDSLDVEDPDNYNPFDYRHYLNNIPQPMSPTLSRIGTPMSTYSPALNASYASPRAPVHRPVPRSDPGVPAPQRKPPKRNLPPPVVRVDPAPVLTIDFDDPVPARAPATQHRTPLAGPISLRSAAASANASPAGLLPRKMGRVGRRKEEEELVFEDVDMGPEDADADEDAGDDDVTMEGPEDGDIEEMILPSPGYRDQAVDVEAGGDLAEDEDEFARAMEQAISGDEDEAAPLVPVVAPRHEEEEESEEE